MMENKKNPLLAIIKVYKW